MRVCGRVVTRDRASGIVADATGTVRVVGAGLPEPLSLVELWGTWDGVEIQAAEVLFAQANQGFGELGQSEFFGLTRHRNQRAHRLFERARLLAELRAFFVERAFLEVETQLLVPSPGLDVHLSAMGVQTSAGERFLITSPEYQMKRLLAGGLTRIFQLCKCFRNDEIGDRHQPEFTMVEWYRAFAGVEDVMLDTEALVARLARASQHAPSDSPAILRTALGDLDVTPPWPRLSVREAFARYTSTSMDDAVKDEERFYRLMIEDIEPALREYPAVFLCEYPASMASLARRKPSDPSVAERFEAYVAGIELCNGFGELTCPVEQRARLSADQAERARLGLPVYPLDERFLSALEQGVPPSGGNALGVDRLLMLALGADHIEDVLAIPGSLL